MLPVGTFQTKEWKASLKTQKYIPNRNGGMIILNSTNDREKIPNRDASISHKSSNAKSDSGGQASFKIGVGGLYITDDDKRMVLDVLNSNRLSYGTYTRSFEQKFANLHDSRYGVFTNSGTSSLEIAVAALKEKYGWQNGDEIIVPAITFIATSNIVLLNSLVPVFVDVDPLTYNIDPSKIREKITARTRAIIPVHLLGLPADMDPIMAISREFNLIIIEDSAETMFARYRGKPVGSFGEISCFSTYVAHYIVTGVGGINLTSDPQDAVLLRSLMNHGRDSIYMNIDDDNLSDRNKLHEVVERRFNFVRIGYSYRATEMEAALGLSQLNRYKEIVFKRKENADKLVRGLSDLREFMQLPTVPDGVEHTFMLFGLMEKTGSKRELVNYLEDNGIETRDLLPLINQPIYRKIFGNLDRKYPVADSINRNGFYIGTHQYLTERDIDYVTKVFHSFYKR